MTRALDPERYALIRALFHRAAELDTRERAAFLRAECADDASLRAEVERLFAARTEPDVFDSEVELREAMFAELGSERGADRLGAPERVGPYRLVRRIGAGGMGQVFEAVQEKPRRRVAVKLIHTDWVSPRGARRFGDEIEILGRLNHPNVARIYDSGAIEGPAGPIRYFAMELVEGRTLARWAREDAPSLAARLAVFRAICEGLIEAHGRGIIQRDLKPENVMLGADGVPRVLDFGIARLADPRLDDAADGGGETRTRQGELIGTPRYMSPEQLAGDPGAVDTRTDVYSLGVMLFELIAGELPTRVGSSTPAGVAEGAEAAEVHPPARSLREVVPDADVDLCTIIAKALERDPAARYPSVRELADDVAAYAERRPIRARVPGLARRLRLFAARRRAAFLGLAVSAATIVLALVLIVLFAVRADDARRLAERSEALAHGQTYRAQISAAASARQAGDVQSARRLLDSTAPERRGFEWGYLRGLLDESTRVLRGHASQVWDVAFSPDGTRLASVGGAVIAEPFDRSLRVWDRATGAELFRVETPDDELLCVAYHPSGRWIVTAGGETDPAIRVWDAVDGRALAALDGHDGRIVGLAFDADGTALFSAANDGLVLRFDVAAAPEAWRADGLLDDDAGEATALVRSGARLFALSEDRPLRVFDVERSSLVAEHDLAGRALAVAPDGRVAVGGADGLVAVVRLGASSAPPTRELLFDLGYPATSLAFARDGETLFGASAGQEVVAWDLRDGLVRARLSGHEAWVNALAIAPDPAGDAVLASAGSEGAIRLWAAPDPRASRTGPEEAALVRGAAVAASGDLFATVDFAGRLRTYELATGELLTERTVPARGVHAVVVDEPRGRLACDAEERILVAPLDGDGPPRFLDGHAGQVRGLALDPTGTRLLSCSSDRTIVLWDLDEGRVLRRIGPLELSAWSVAWSPDGERFATAGDDGFVRVWSAARGELLFAADLDEPVIYSIDWSPDGTRIAAAGWSQTLFVVDAEDGAVLRRLRGHASAIYCVSFSPDGTRLATASVDRSLMLWDTGTGLDLLSVRSFGESLYAVAWSPAGDALVVGREKGLAVLRAEVSPTQ